MEHFSVVQSIIRASLSGDRAALDKHIARLRVRLEKGGALKEAATIGRLLKAATEIKEIKPSKVEVSRTDIQGETLTRDTHAPIDRETGAALCTIHFQRREAIAPVYETPVKESIYGLLKEWRNIKNLQDVGVEPTRSLLIFGPPGSGKTLTAHYIAESLGLPLIVARIDGLISSFLGTTARNIANLFDFANRYACVLLLDEFDALAKQRDDAQEIGEIKRVVNTLLQNLDGRRECGITIAITNHDRLLDSAVWRRFEMHVHLGDPGGVARDGLIKRFLQPVETDPAILSIISYCLVGYSGGDIERICTSIKRYLALGETRYDEASLFQALHAVLRQLPSHLDIRARTLASDPEAFISLIANDGEFPLTQAEIGRATGYGQSKVSVIKKENKHLTFLEATNA